MSQRLRRTKRQDRGQRFLVGVDVREDQVLHRLDVLRASGAAATAPLHDPARHLVRAPRACVHGQVGQAVGGFPLGEQRLHSLTIPASGRQPSSRNRGRGSCSRSQRSQTTTAPLAAAPRASRARRRRRRRWPRRTRSAAASVLGGAAAPRRGRTPRRARRRSRPPRWPARLLDQRVEVDESPAQHAGQDRADRALARPHEADEDDPRHLRPAGAPRQEVVELGEGDRGALGVLDLGLALGPERRHRERHRDAVVAVRAHRGAAQRPARRGPRGRRAAPRPRRPCASGPSASAAMRSLSLTRSSAAPVRPEARRRRRRPPRRGPGPRRSAPARSPAPRSTPCSRDERATIQPTGSGCRRHEARSRCPRPWRAARRGTRRAAGSAARRRCAPRSPGGSSAATTRNAALETSPGTVSRGAVQPAATLDRDREPVALDRRRRRRAAGARCGRGSGPAHAPWSGPRPGGPPAGRPS